MKANELIIGDWVKYKKDYQKVNVNTFRFLQERNELFEPIPITPEILGKIGFCEGQYFYFLDGLNNDEDVITQNDYDFKIKSKTLEMDIRCKYIHELQHALRLAKINKEIIL